MIVLVSSVIQLNRIIWMCVFIYPCLLFIFLSTPNSKMFASQQSLNTQQKLALEIRTLISPKKKSLIKKEPKKVIDPETVDLDLELTACILWTASLSRPTLKYVTKMAFDRESYDDEIYGKKRARLDKRVVDKLLFHYFTDTDSSKKYPSKTEMYYLAQIFHIHPYKVQIWFQNYRQKLNRDALVDSDSPTKSSTDLSEDSFSEDTADPTEYPSARFVNNKLCSGSVPPLQKDRNRFKRRISYRLSTTTKSNDKK